MEIGIISDTHMPKRAKKIPHEVLTAFKDVDLIIHAGDLCNEAVIKELEALAPVNAVCGNIDDISLQQKLPKKLNINANGFLIGVIHGDGGKRGKTLDRAVEAFKEDNVDCIIFGHSHIPHISLRGEVLLFNPGSATDKRRNRYFSYGLLTIKDKIEARIVYF
ncbi:metallophosphoesterase family protein [Alkaliphilus pronyensis]|uniref:Phosphoesterase n=1 Tax=Alkaliphilus pronyensis TaxID=1482732 RepID=A0A6I0F483_9FIRM|nr:metallophosphoesterase family protein [Alkaliphilus pronyensis]KAB3537310.1 metallophosphoesterase family protein [Alkaliphilus pronyensis]